MPKQEYPKWVYGPDGKSALVETIEQHTALGPTYHEEPWAKDGTPPAARVHDPEAVYPGDLTLSAKNAAAPKQEYPKWVYHLNEKAQQVNSEDQHDALGAGWYECPAEAKAAGQAAQPAVPAPPAGGSMSEAPSTPPSAPAAGALLNINELNVTEAALYVETVEGLEELARLALAEEQGRNRVTVKKAIEARIVVLTKPPVPAS